MTFDVTLEESIEYLKKNLEDNGFSVNDYEMEKVRNFVESILEEKKEKIHINYELDFINKAGKVKYMVKGKEVSNNSFSFTGTRTREHVKKLILLNNIVENEEDIWRKM